MSYFDKGPGVSWTIAMGTRLFGDTVFGVRFFAVLLSIATGWWVFILGRRLFDPKVGLCALLLAAVVPMYAVGAILMTIDPLSVFFWVIAAYAFWRGWTSGWTPWWVLAGAFVGLGALCKYVNLLELLAFGSFLVIERGSSSRPVLFRFALLLVVAFLLCTPMLYWSAQHDWASMRHLVERGGIEAGWRFSPPQALSFLGQQAGVISPVIFIGVIWAVLWPGPLLERRRVEVRFVQTLFLPLFLFYLILSLNKTGQPNWTAPAYIGGLILLSARILPLLASPGKFRVASACGVGLAILLTILLHNNTAWLHLPPRKDPLDRARGSRDLAGQLESLMKQNDAKFLIASKYSTASLMAFYVSGHPHVYLPDTRPRVDNQFSIWPGYEVERSGSNAVFVTEFDQIPPNVTRDFRTTDSLGVITSEQDGRIIQRYQAWICRDLVASRSVITP